MNILGSDIVKIFYGVNLACNKGKKMQAITSRQNRLLKFLLQHREYVTLLKIAQFLNVSEKTVQRDLRELEQWLADRKITINKRSGAGVMLLAENVTDFLQLDLSMGGEGYDVDVMLNNSRRVKIASQLLNETPHETSISKLSERYFISNASIVNDLKIIESWIALLGLSLIRSQSGTHIEGSENNVRQAIASLINGIINHNEMGAIIHSRLDLGSYKALVHYFDEEDVLFVQRLLQDMEKKLCWSMGEPYYVNIFTHTGPASIRWRWRLVLPTGSTRKECNLNSRCTFCVTSPIACLSPWCCTVVPQIRTPKSLSR